MHKLLFLSILLISCKGHISPVDSNSNSATDTQNIKITYNTQRFKDISGRKYKTSFISGYKNQDAKINLFYHKLGKTFKGKIQASGLKPNFAYQLKLVGDRRFESNEFIGFSGRWSKFLKSDQKFSYYGNLNDKGDGYGLNPNDHYYLDHQNNPAMYFVGYLVFDYVVSDERGNIDHDFELENSLHVLWKSVQREAQEGDKLIRKIIFNSNPKFYDSSFSNQKVTIYGEWERKENPLKLSTGQYDSFFVLTEESFHENGPYSGHWATVYNEKVSFKIIP